MMIKVCGMRDIENLMGIYEAGIRMMGFIFYAKSKRYIDQESRKQLFDRIPDDVKKVGVFVNESLDFVFNIISEFGLDYAQLHGNESPSYCSKVQNRCKVIKAFSVDNDFDFSTCDAYQNCDYLLFDAKGKKYGGNGIKYNWELLKNYKLEKPFLLSGGIGPQDVDKILGFEHPKMVGIDVNSGFESEPGLKNIEVIKSFTSYLRCSTQ